MTNSVDDKLNSGSQRAIARAVASLPDESVSMVWRSELNEALRATAVKAKRKKLMFNFVSPIAGLGLACALALIVPVSLRPRQELHPAGAPVSAPVASSLEAGLIRVHQDDVRTSDVAGTGLNPVDAVAVSQPNSTNVPDDSEDDLQL